MYLRISSAFMLAALLAACSSNNATDAEAASAAGRTGSGTPGAVASVPCALVGAKSFTADCSVEREVRQGKTLVTVHHPDGGFRRLIELEGGKRFAAADGSDQVSIVANGREVEVTLGDDHYLFPAAAPGAEASASASAR